MKYVVVIHVKTQKKWEIVANQRKDKELLRHIKQQKVAIFTVVVCFVFVTISSSLNDDASATKSELQADTAKPALQHSSQKSRF